MAGIGDLVARLGIDNTDFTKKLKGASSSLRSFAGGIGGIVAPIAATLAGVWGTSASISGYKTALENQRKFQAVLEATGGTAGVTTQEMADYAAELQRVTNFEDDATVGAAAFLASMNNITGDNFKRSVALAQDMATVMGTDLDSAVKKMAKSFKDLAPEEVTKKLDEMQARFGGAAQAVADPWKQFQNVLGDVGEMIGSTLLPTINVLAQNLSSMLGVVGGVAEAFKSFGIEAAVVLSHSGSLVVLMATQWELFGVQVIENVKHVFTVAIPTYLDWFGKNWSDVLMTAVDFAATIFINLGTNIRSMWSAVMEFFKSGKFEFNWTPMTEGFKNSINALPDVPTRAITDFEKGLADSVKSQTEELGKSMDAQRTALEDRFAIKPLKTFADTEGEDSSSKPKAGKQPINTATAAAVKGSSAALSAIYAATRNQTPERQLKIAEQSLAEQRKQTAKLDKLASGGQSVVGMAIG